jgi:hypothetical protein
MDLLRYSRACILSHFQGVKYLFVPKRKFESSNFKMMKSMKRVKESEKVKE